MEGDCVIHSCSLWGEKEPIKEKQEIQIWSYNLLIDT